MRPVIGAVVPVVTRQGTVLVDEGSHILAPRGYAPVIRRPAGPARADRPPPGFKTFW